MPKKNGISWTDETWNPVVGCSLISPGCTNCYAMKRAAFLVEQGITHYQGLVRTVNDEPVWTGVVRRAPDHIMTKPLRWRRPRLIFVNSMSDLFHEQLQLEVIYEVLDVIHAARSHVFQVLTKRSARMRTLVRLWADDRGVNFLPNLVLGVSVEDQRRLDQRLPDLAQVRDLSWTFVSAEPLLERVDFRGQVPPDQLVVGGESLSPRQRARGKRARPFDVAWAVELADWCRRTGVAFHMKQLGENPVGAERQSAKGDKPHEWPKALRIRQSPFPLPGSSVLLSGEARRAA